MRPSDVSCDLAEPFGHRPEACGRDEHAPHRIEDRRVLPRSENDQVGPVGPGDRRHDLLKNLQVTGIGDRRRKWDVDGCAFGASATGRAQEPSARRIPPGLVDG